MEASAKKGWKKLRGATAATGALKAAGIAKNMRKPKGFEKSYTLGSPSARLSSLRDAAESERRREIAREKIERELIEGALERAQTLLTKETNEADQLRLGETFTQELKAQR